MAPLPDYVAMESEYQVESRRHEKISSPSHRPSRQTKRAPRPKSFNGIHRRRTKRIAW